MNRRELKYKEVMDNQFFFRSVQIAHKVEVEPKNKGKQKKQSLFEDVFSTFFVFIEFYEHSLPDPNDPAADFDKSFDLCSLTILHNEFIEGLPIYQAKLKADQCLNPEIYWTKEHLNSVRHAFEAKTD